MQVEDIFSRDPLYVEESTYLTKARQLIRDNHVRGLPVVNSKKNVIGIVTTQDMLRVTSTKSNITVSGFTVQVPNVTEQTEMLDAARIMLKEKSTLLPVVESLEKPVLKGVITLLDVFKHIDLTKIPDSEIRAIMSTKVVTASPDEPLTKVWDRMVEQDFTGLPVVKDGKPIGMITRFDILKRGWARIGRESETRPVDSTQMRAEKLMSSPLYFIGPDSSFANAIDLMLKYDVGRISVVDEGKLVGIVDRNDLIKSYLGE
jgi:CBS domain-containing protein